MRKYSKNELVDALDNAEEMIKSLKNDFSRKIKLRFKEVLKMVLSMGGNT